MILLLPLYYGHKNKYCWLAGGMSAVKDENKAEKWRELTVLDVQSVQSPVNCLERYKIARSDQIWPEFIGLEWNRQLPAVYPSQWYGEKNEGKKKLESVSDIFNY